VVWFSYLFPDLSKHDRPLRLQFVVSGDAGCSPARPGTVLSRQIILGEENMPHFLTATATLVRFDRTNRNRFQVRVTWARCSIAFGCFCQCGLSSTGWASPHARARPPERNCSDFSACWRCCFQWSPTMMTCCSSSYWVPPLPRFWRVLSRR